MFNIGWTELLLIAIVFLIFIKPKDFPLFIKNIANFFYKIKNYVADIKDEFEGEIYINEFKKKNKEILKIEKELKKLKKK
jgi:sec-independent protein translocase protein TatB